MCSSAWGGSGSDLVERSLGPVGRPTGRPLCLDGGWDDLDIGGGSGLDQAPRRQSWGGQDKRQQWRQAWQEPQ